MTEEKTKPIFSPQNVAVSAYKIIEERANNPQVGVLTGIPSLDAKLNPHRPGELRVVLGYTSNYKTGLMNYIARHAAQEINRRGDNDRVVVSVTWEQSVQEQGVTDLAQISGINITRMMRGETGAEDWSKLRRAAAERGGMPWWLIGHSVQAGERRPRLSMTDLAEALAYLVDVQNVTIELLTLDYLQRIRRENDSGDRTRVAFMDMVDRAKDAALAFSCPVLLGSQAGRQVKTRAWRLPQPDDGQETSNLEQSADSLLSVWMPKQDYPPGHTISWGSSEYQVSDNLLVLGVLKQKFGSAPHILPLHVRPEINEIGDMQATTVQL